MERIFGLLRAGRIEWLSSTALEAETGGNLDAERRYEADVLLTLATGTVPLDSRIIQRAVHLEALGYGPFDALHLSCAEAGAAEVLPTTDDRFSRRAARGIGSPRIRALNPIEWLRKHKV